MMITIIMMIKMMIMPTIQTSYEFCMINKDH